MIPAGANCSTLTAMPSMFPNVASLGLIHGAEGGLSGRAMVPPVSGNDKRSNNKCDAFNACARTGTAPGSRDHRDRHPIYRESVERDTQLRPAASWNDTNIAWWLRLKGVRDIVSGLAVVLAFMMRSAPSRVGIILLVEAIIPMGDMLLILAAKGSTKSAFGIHGLTAVLMVLTAMPLMIDVA
jgi:hypothetical protein